MGWGQWEGAGRDKQRTTEGPFSSSLSLNELKITVGKCTLSLCNLREVLTPPGLSLPIGWHCRRTCGDGFFVAKRMKNWGILSRDAVYSPSFEVFHQGWSPYQKNMLYFISKFRVCARNTQGNYLFVMKEELMRWSQRSVLFKIPRVKNLYNLMFLTCFEIFRGKVPLDSIGWINLLE